MYYLHSFVTIIVVIMITSIYNNNVLVTLFVSIMILAWVYTKQILISDGIEEEKVNEKIKLTLIMNGFVIAMLPSIMSFINKPIENFGSQEAILFASLLAPVISILIIFAAFSQENAQMKKKLFNYGTGTFFTFTALATFLYIWLLLSGASLV